MRKIMIVNRYAALVVLALACARAFAGEQESNQSIEPGRGLQGRSIPTLAGGQIVQLSWDAAPLPDHPSTYPRMPSFGAQRFPADVQSEAMASRLGGIGWDGLMCVEINWYEPPEQIAAKTSEYRQLFDLSKRKGMHDNLIACMFTYANGDRPPANPAFGPKLPQWHEDDKWELLLAYFDALGKIAKESGAVGVTFDVEEYSQGLFHPNMYPDHPDIRQIVNRRGYQLAKAMLAHFPDMWLLILPNHYLWGFPEKDMPELMVPMAEGIMTAFAEVQKDQAEGGVVFCSEFTYGYHGLNMMGWKNDLEGARKTVAHEYNGMRKALAEWGKKNPEYFEKRVQLGAGIWPLGDYLGDEGNGTNVRYDTEAFRNMVTAAKERCPRWLWIYTQDDTWVYQNFDDFNRVMHSVHARPQYLVGETLVEGGAAWTPLPGAGDRTVKAGQKTYALSIQKVLPDATPRKYVLGAEFDQQPMAGFGGEIELKPEASAIADDFSEPALHQDWSPRTFHPQRHTEDVSDNTGILIKPQNGQLVVIGSGRGTDAGSAVRLSPWIITQGTVSVDLAGYDLDPNAQIGGSACLALVGDAKHWFRVERSYNRADHWAPEEKRHSNGLYYSWQNGEQGEIAKRGIHLIEGRTTPLKLTYEKGLLTCYAGEARVFQQEMAFPGGFVVELGGFAPEGVKLAAKFDNLIIDGVRAE